MKAVLTVGVGLLLTAGLANSPAGAAVANTAKTSAATSTAKPQQANMIQPLTLTSCDIGSNNTYEYLGWCAGSGPTSYRAVAYCANGMLALGIELHDGDHTSTATCHANGMNSTLQTDWGWLLCSTNNGTGTYQGYYNRHGDISQWMYQLGKGSIPAGGTTLCQYDTSGPTAISPVPISSAIRR